MDESPANIVQPTDQKLMLDRRSVLVGLLGIGVGAGVTNSLLGEGFFQSQMPEQTDPVLQKKLFSAFYKSLSSSQSDALVKPWGHPFQQVGNVAPFVHEVNFRNVLKPEQLAMFNLLLRQDLPKDPKQAINALFNIENSGLKPCELTIYGEPENGPCQMVLAGGHMTYRINYDLIQDRAFGGSIGWGFEKSNAIPHTPGNVYNPLRDKANTTFYALEENLQSQAVVSDRHPSEYRNQIQGDDGVFSGVAVNQFNENQKTLLVETINELFQNYPKYEQDHAWKIIKDNGGLEALHFSVFTDGGFYENSEPVSAEQTKFYTFERFPEQARGNASWHIFRIEGPGTIIQNRGWPHGHSFMHIVANKGESQHFGETLAESDRLITVPEVNQLLAKATEAQFQSDYTRLYRSEAIIPKGKLSEGMVCAMDPWGARLCQVKMRVKDINPWAMEDFVAMGMNKKPDEMVTLTLPSSSAIFLRIESKLEDYQESSLRLRDIFLAYFKENQLNDLASLDTKKA